MPSLRDLEHKVLRKLLTQGEIDSTNNDITTANSGLSVVVSGSVQAIPLVAESVSAQGTQDAPGAGTVIAQIASGSLFGAGIYDVEVEACFLVGAPAAAEDLNIELREGSQGRKRILVPRALNVLGFGKVRLNLDGSTDIIVRNVNAATAGVRYGASVTATMVR